MADLDDIDRKLSTANWLNGANLVANADAAASARRMANALEEQNQRARIADERQARIGMLRNALFEAERIVDEIRASLASLLDKNALMPSDAMTGVVRTLEVQVFLNQDGALDAAAFDLLDDKRYAESMRKKILAQLEYIESVRPGTLLAVENWNVSEWVCAKIQAFLVYDGLLRKPLRPDGHEKWIRLSKMGAGAFVLVVAVDCFSGFTIAMTVAAICVAIVAWFVRQPGPLSHGRRREIAPTWHPLLPKGVLTTEKLTRYRAEAAAELEPFGIYADNAEVRLTALNDSRQNAIESGVIPNRPNHCVLRPYTGRFITPEV